MEMLRKIAATAELALYGGVQVFYWLTFGRSHPGYDGLWRHRYAFNHIWFHHPVPSAEEERA